MKPIIVGSTALWTCGVINRSPNDLDLWVSKDDPKTYAGDVTHMPESIMSLVECTYPDVASVNSVYTIKLSHLGWDIFFEKHKRDVLYLESQGAKVIPELYKALLAHWKVEHGNKDFLSLYKDKTEFFTDHVEYVYDHDYLHELVAYPNRPVYEKCLKSGQEVAIDKDKFFAMPFEDQVRMFREEITVIAAERWLLNPKVRGKLSWRQAYQYSLRKTVTQLTKNWATDFLVLNLDRFYKPDYDYFKHLIETLMEETTMSKVDTSVFEGIMNDDRLTNDWGSDTMRGVIMGLATGDVGVAHGLTYPVRGEREHKDPTYQAELEEYNEKRKEAREAFFAEYDYEHLEQDGGGEGGSEYCYGVFRFGGKIYMTSWSYFSHHGYEYDYVEGNLKEVQAKQKTITVYE